MLSIGNGMLESVPIESIESTSSLFLKMPDFRFPLYVCLAYLAGLLSTCSDWGKWACLGVGTIVSLLLPRWRRRWLTRRQWLILTAIAFLAAWYWQWRLPTPGVDDVSTFVGSTNAQGENQYTIVRGLVDSEPRTTRGDRVQFWLQAQRVDRLQGNEAKPAAVSQPVSGRLYVTAPLLAGTGLQSQMEVAVTGTLYKPPVALNPGGFDFRAYLARSGGFAGMRAMQVNVPEEFQANRWSWRRIRTYIASSQIKWLDVPAGPIVSAMALGADAVDLPTDLRENFTRSGLAHALAASGFQVSLILAAVLKLTEGRLSPRQQAIAGGIALLAFLGLAGAQPAVLRSVVMGFGVLVALVLKRQAEPLATLVMAAVLLLLINPLWIWDVGFLLSFLATLGLIVSAEPFQKRLEVLPPTIAAAIAVPLAASVWTLPVQLFVFKVIPVYSILANVLTAPLISIVSLGSIVSAILAFMPGIGETLAAASAWLLALPTHLLIGIVNVTNMLPGATLVVGQISPWQLISLYGTIVAIWFLPKWQKQWRIPAILAIAIVIVPLFFGRYQEFSITALATGKTPVLIVRDRGMTTAIDSGDTNTAKFILLPFLQDRAVNRLNRAIALTRTNTTPTAWDTLANDIPIDRIYSSLDDLQTSAGTIPQSRRYAIEPLTVGNPLELEGIKLNLLAKIPPVLHLSIPRNSVSWLFIGGQATIDKQENLINSTQLPQVTALYWDGSKLLRKFVDAVSPKFAICSINNPDPETITYLEKKEIKVFQTIKDGAVEWTPDRGFYPTID